MSPDKPASGVVAAIDCGTNSTRLIVVADGGTVLDRQMLVTRLGEGVDATGRLSGPAIERTLAVLGGYRARMDELGVTSVRMVATSAARDAANAQEFFDGAQRVVGVVPELLSGDDEGRLSFTGATAHLPASVPPGELSLVVDIGGGSTELAVGIPSRPDQVRAVSLDIGCVRVTERFLTGDRPGADQLARARDHVDDQLGQAQAVMGAGLEARGPVIGLAGTVSTLAALEFQVRTYSRAALHHRVLDRSAVARWLEVLSAEAVAERLERPGMLEGRADVIVGGALILDRVMDVFDRGWCLVSEDDILDGLAASLRR